MKTKIFFVVFGLISAIFIEWDLFNLWGPRLLWHLHEFGLAVGLFAMMSALAAALWWGSFYVKAEKQITPYQVFRFLLFLSTALYIGIRLNYNPMKGLHQDMDIYLILILASHVSYLCPPLFAVAKLRV